jgi:hypothetical protein
MATHILKTWPAYFDAIATGAKTFEARLNDRDFKPGDKLILMEFKPLGSKEAPQAGTHTGRVITARVTYILFGPNFGIKKGYCIMALANTERKRKRRPAKQLSLKME